MIRLSVPNSYRSDELLFFFTESTESKKTSRLCVFVIFAFDLTGFLGARFVHSRRRQQAAYWKAAAGLPQSKH